MNDLSALIQMTLLCSAIAAVVAVPAIIGLFAFNKYRSGKDLAD